ncbi:Uncharacterised protein [Mycobacteroides abscessus subsp. massiliense]|nr:Uncharacterised protein [Mycobacteroides abscessus subsp. massiliense]
MPKVPHTSMPKPFTALMISETTATSLGLGPRHAAPMQKRLAPRDWAILAFSTISSTSIMRLALGLTAQGYGRYGHSVFFRVYSDAVSLTA